MSSPTKYLFPSLEGGSSRIFNICARSAQLVDAMREDGDDSEPKFLFNTQELNQSILVKEVRTDRKNARYQYANTVGTKLYLPYNPARPYEGGKSAFLDDPRIQDILLDHAGIDTGSRSAKVKADLAIIRLLDEIPSLDPFLVKDKLRVEGVEANEFYFEISDEEWHAIKAHVSDMLKPVIDFAFQDSEEMQRGRTMALIAKLWDTKDITALKPIIAAFNLPPDEAKGIFAAWKGVMYYDYEYNRCQSDWRVYGAWLEQDAVPLDFVEPERKQHLLDLIENVRTQYSAAKTELQEIFSSYESAYETLFVERKDSAPFIDFMRKAVRAYWILGTKLSAINHCVTVWEIMTARSFKRRLKFEQLFELLELQREIFDNS